MVSQRQIFKALIRLPEKNYIQEHDNGFVVIFKYPKSQKILSAQSFDFMDYLDGKPEALYWAKEWRNNKYSQLLKNGLLPLPNQKDNRPFLYANNNKETGISRAFEKTQAKEIKEVFITSWFEKRRNKKGYVVQTRKYRTFKVGQYGRKQAKKLATDLWQQKVKLSSIPLT